jgi:hypothetical protein
LNKGPKAGKPLESTLGNCCTPASKRAGGVVRGDAAREGRGSEVRLVIGVGFLDHFWRTIVRTFTFVLGEMETQCWARTTCTHFPNALGPINLLHTLGLR